MKKQEISAKVTEIISSYFSKGYIIYPRAMGGSQGQDFSIVLRNGNDGVAISGWDSRSHCITKQHELHMDTYEIWMDTYEIWIESFNVDKFESRRLIFWFQSEKDLYDWKEDQQVIRYFRPCHEKDWYVTEDEAVAIYDKQCKRAMSRRISTNDRIKTFKSYEAKKLAVDIAKKHRGYKRTKIEDVNAISLNTDFLGKKHIVIDLNRKPSKNASIKLVIDK